MNVRKARSEGTDSKAEMPLTSGAHSLAWHTESRLQLSTLALSSLRAWRTSYSDSEPTDELFMQDELF